ncbi:MAG: nucleotidyltransferase family protein [Clostridia bacterium]|nr:nucleotidyltransferase family protein [Clostridia bacterium]
MSNKPSKLNNHEKMLLDLLANGLFDLRRKVDMNAPEINTVWLEAYFQTVTLVAFSGTDKSSGGKNINRALADNAKIDYEHTRIHGIMTEAGIPYVILKGFASALYYRDPLMRSMGDVDFLVHPDFIGAARDAMEKNGYEITDKTREIHDVYIKNGCRCELHSEPAGIPKGEAGEKVRAYLADVIECSEEVETEVGTVRVPSDFHHGLIILLHMCHHLTGDGLGMRHLCDWAVFIASLGEEKFLELFEAPLKDIGLWKAARIMTAIASDYLGAPKMKWAENADRALAKRILRDVFSGGNFGQKSSDRSHESLLISNKNEKNVPMIKQLFKSANSIVRSNWKAAEKYKILLPIGWIFFGGRYLIRSVFGKRPAVRVKKIAKEAAQRKELYAKLDMFKSF